MTECHKISEMLDRLDVLEQRIEAIEEASSRVFNQTEAAKYLGISRPTLRAHTKYGLIAPLPGTTKFLKKELDRYKNIHSKS